MHYKTKVCLHNLLERKLLSYAPFFRNALSIFEISYEPFFAEASLLASQGTGKPFVGCIAVVFAQSATFLIFFILRTCRASEVTAGRVHLPGISGWAGSATALRNALSQNIPDISWFADTSGNTHFQAINRFVDAFACTLTAGSTYRKTSFAGH